MSRTRPCKHCGTTCDDIQRGYSEDAHMRGVHCARHIHPECLIDPVSVTISKSDAYHAMRMLDDLAYEARIQAGNLRDSMPQTSLDTAARAGIWERLADALGRRHGWVES